jgi:hypothetical protein
MSLRINGRRKTPRPDGNAKLALIRKHKFE